MADVIQNVLVQRTTTTGGQFTDFVPANEIGANATYTPPGAGAVATTVAAKLQQTVSVFDFMTAAQQNNVALNLGNIDVSAAITAADLAATAAGKNLFFPPGVYGIPVPVGAGASAITGNGASWRAYSRDSTILKSLAGTYQPGQRMITWPSLSNFTIESIGFDVSLATCAGSNTNVCYQYHGRGGGASVCEHLSGQRHDVDGGGLPMTSHSLKEDGSGAYHKV
jgi:hypothetical protein